MNLARTKLVVRRAAKRAKAKAKKQKGVFHIRNIAFVIDMQTVVNHKKWLRTKTPNLSFVAETNKNNLLGGQSATENGHNNGQYALLPF